MKIHRVLTQLPPHNYMHQDGGADEVDVTDLSGDLADLQDPKVHGMSHEFTGGDEFSMNSLGGVLSETQYPKPHPLTSAAYHTGTGLAVGSVLVALTASTFGFTSQKFFFQAVDNSTPLINTAGTCAWTDLDITAQTSANARIATLSVVFNSLVTNGTCHIRFRQKGFTLDGDENPGILYHPRNGTNGAILITPILISLDAVQVLQYRILDNDGTILVYINGYIEGDVGS